jgi:methylmalonyl-CoA/ethylmalonyl-CoA epimerase
MGATVDASQPRTSPHRDVAAGGRRSRGGRRPAPELVLDHLAIAVADWTDAGDELARRLGGDWQYGLRTGAFNPCQIGFGNDTRIELLAPPDSGTSFVTDYLERQGRNRPHHITLKTDDIESVLDDARDFGIEPVLVRMGDTRWQEGFLHPKDTGLGVVIQVAQSEGDPVQDIPDDMRVACPWPSTEPAGERAAIEYLVVGVEDLDRATRLCCDVLRGEVVVTIDSVVRLEWPSGAHLVLTALPSEDPGPLGVVAIGISGAAPGDLPLVPDRFGWSKSPVLEPLGLSLLFQTPPDQSPANHPAR